MAVLNILAATICQQKTATLDVTTSAAAIVTCAANESCRVRSLHLANVDGTNSVDVTVLHVRGATSTEILKTVSLPADSTLVLFGDGLLHLEESDVLQVQASANSDCKAVCSYERFA